MTFFRIFPNFVSFCALAAGVLTTSARPANGDEARAQAKEKPARTKPGKPGVDDDWPQWRGPRRDAVSTETGLLETWPEGGPKLLWTSQDAGVGYSGPAVKNGKLYLLGGDKGTVAFAINVKTGKRLWTSPPLAEVYENDWGDGPRSTPTLDGGKLYCLSATGTLACLDASKGKILWRKELVADFGGAVPSWGYCESPLVVGKRLFITPGGKNCVVALNKENGSTLWTSTGLDDAAQYSSLVPLRVDGLDMLVTMTNRGLVGLNAANGKLLWRFEKTANGTAVIPTPIVKDNLVYSTSGYGTGCGLVKLKVQGSNCDAEEVYFNKVMKNQHGGVLLVGDHVYGYSDGTGWVCQSLETGELVWRDKKLGKGSVLAAEGKLYCYSEDDGTVVLADASPDGWTERGRFTIPKSSAIPRKSGHIWTHPVVAEGRLFLRDHELLFCFELKESK
ncbi:MAG: PQQ-binding-like beta-propeller repeat protein [Planctomycetota bacterium]